MVGGSHVTEGHGGRMQSLVTHACRLVAPSPLEPVATAVAKVAVRGLLADRAQHRAPAVPDPLIAATAELAGLTVLHLDEDFDLIAALTGQPVERPDTSTR